MTLAQTHGGWILAALMVLAVLVLVLVLLALRKGRAKPEGKTAVPATSGGVGTVDSRSGGGLLTTWAVFRMGRARLAERLGQRPDYILPWILVLGEKGAGKTSLLRSAKLPRLIPSEETLRGEHVSLHGFEEAVVLDVDGDLVLKPNGQPGSERRWRDVIRALQWYRPERGLDGLVLVLPCDDLIGPTALGPQGLEEKGNALRDRLWELEKATGLRLPVYVVVTKCDRIQEFAAFWQVPPRGGLGTMVGWSRPGNPDEPFNPADLDGAFWELTNNLWGHYVDAAAALDKPDDPDGMFLFPGAFAGLRDPLRILLARLFRVSSYQDGHFLRGVWFTGATDTREAGELLTPSGDTLPMTRALTSFSGREGPTVDAGVLFATDLLGEKVFRESRIARAARSGLIGRTNASRTAQAGLVVASVVLALGVVVNGLLLGNLADQLERPLALIATEGSVKRDAFDSAAADRLLRQFQEIDRGTMIFPFLWPSWGRVLQGKVEDRFTTGLENLVLHSMSVELDLRYQRLNAFSAADPIPAESSHVLDTAPDLARLIAFVQRVSRLDRLADGYSTAHEGSLSSLADLANSLFGSTLKGDFTRNAGLYERALRQASPTRIKSHLQVVEPRFKELADALVRRLGPGGPIAQRAIALKESLDGVQLLKTGDTGARFDEMATRLLDVREMLDDPAFHWLGRGDITAEPSVALLLESMKGVSSLSDETRTAFIDDLRKAHVGLRTELSALVDGDGGKIFEVSTQGSGLRLNKPLNDFSEFFRPMLNRPFMRLRPDRVLAMPPSLSDERILRWDPERLDQAIERYRSYEEFLVYDLPRVPANFQTVMRRLATERLERALRSDLADAQRIGPGPDLELDFGLAALEAEIADLRAVTGPLVTILGILREHRLDRLQSQLRQVLRAQSSGLLERVDDIAAMESFYESASAFDAWDGRGSPLEAGFAAVDDVAVAQVLDGTRDRLEYYWGVLAAPLVDLMLRKEMGEGWYPGGALVRWRAIGAELDRYAAKDPNSHLAALENFMRFDLAAVRLDSCETKLGALDTRLSSDFFRARQLQLQTEVLDRCRALTGEEIFADYTRLADQFNRTLAGSYPFVSGQPLDESAEANPDEVALFLRDFGAVSDRLRSGLGQRARSDRTVRPALEFVERMVAVQAFLAPFAAPSPDQAEPPAPLEVAARFRVNRARERNANQIIEWSLRVGSAELTAAGEPAAAVWRPGDPVELRLRWAKDGSAEPRALAEGPAVVDGRTALFAYDGRWALIRMLDAHRAEPDDFDRGTDPDPHTLRFTVPIAPVVDGDLISTATGESRLYVRLGLSSRAPASDDPKAKAAGPRRHLLPVFPAEAPSLKLGAIRLGGT